MPESGSTAKAPAGAVPPAASAYVTVPPLTSVDASVMPTAVPLAALNWTVPPVAPSESVGCDGATLVTAMLKF